jgi:hypothetical protein
MQNAVFFSISNINVNSSCSQFQVICGSDCYVILQVVDMHVCADNRDL